MADIHRVNPAIRFSLLALCVLTFAARFFTLNADFPAGIDWSASLYSDEGWYAGGAVNNYISGSWYTPGDLNTAINFPTLQILEAGYYRIFGLSLASTRSLTVIFTALLVLLSYLITRKLAGEVAALICTGLLTCNFFLFGFSKFAILEIPMVSLVLLAIWWVVSRTKLSLWQAIILAFIFSLALLTKASAIFGLPVLVLAIWQKPASRRSKTWASLVFLAGVACLYGGYILWILQLYPSDYLSYNEYSLAPRITWSLYYFFWTAGRVVWNGRVIDPVLYSISVFVVPCGLLLFQRYRQNSLVQLSLIWLVTQSIILISRGYLPPRYYLLFIVPVMMLFSILMTMGFKDIKPLFSYRIGPVVSKISAYLKNLAPAYVRILPVVLIAIIGMYNLVKIGGYLFSPNYTYINTIKDIQHQIENSGLPDPVLLGGMAQTMSIELHIATVNTQYGTQSLLWKLEEYHPDFYVALGTESKIRDQISQLYDLELLDTYNVFGNYYAGKPVYFYRLVPLAAGSGAQ